VRYRFHRTLHRRAALAAGTVAAGEIGDQHLTILRRRGAAVLCAPFDAEGDHDLLAAFAASRASSL
jgi:hypothetical protein